MREVRREVRGGGSKGLGERWVLPIKYVERESDVE